MYFFELSVLMEFTAVVAFCWLGEENSHNIGSYNQAAIIINIKLEIEETARLYPFVQKLCIISIYFTVKGRYLHRAVWTFHFRG